MPKELPKTLIDAVKNNTLIPFIGAGISIGIKDKENNQLFDNWTNSLLNSVKILEEENEKSKALNIKTELDIEPVDYLAIGSKIQKYLNSNWNKYLTITFNKEYSEINKETLAIPKEILKINTLAITTNYDNVLKWSSDEIHDLIELDKKSLYGQVESLKKIPKKQTIWYLHGKISNPEDIVFTKESYEETYKEDSAPIEILKSHLVTKNFIFCGFSLDDPYIKMQLKKVKNIFGTNISKHYIIIQKGHQKDFSFLGDIQFLEVDDYNEDYLNLLKEINNIKKNNEEKEIENTLIKIPDNQKIFNIPFKSKGNDIVGIEGKLEEIHTKLNTSKNLSIGQVTKFEGIGGLGKTQLAVEYAHTYKDFFKNGILWFTMDQDFDEQLLTLGKDFNLVNQNLEPKDQLSIVKNKIRSLTNMLLIYDNTNDLKDLQKDFLPESSSNKIIITTRNPLDGFESIELETLNFENSKHLLQIESSKDVLDEEIKIVKELCTILDGLPLALEMAGAYIKFLNLSWKEYLDLYKKHNIELLNKSKLTESFTKHENNIANTLTISEKVINEVPLLKEILNLLSYGANEPIDKELITKLLGCEEIEIIEAIKIGIKLKYIKESSQGYTIHRLLREVWKIQEKPNEEFTSNTAENLAKYIYKIKDDFFNLSKLEKANLFSEQWINYLKNNDTKAILIAYRAYLDFYKSDFENGLKIVHKAFNIIQNKESLICAEILMYKGSLSYELGDRELAKELHEKSLKIYRNYYKEKDYIDIATSLDHLGTYYRNKEFDTSLNYFNKALEMMKRLYKNKDHLNIAKALNSLGFIWDTRDINKALEYYEASFNMRTRLLGNQDHPHIAGSLNNLGVCWTNKNFFKALDFHEKSFKMRKKLFNNQDHVEIKNSLDNLAFLWEKKDFYKSLDLYKQALEMGKRLFRNQNHPNTISTMFNLSITLCKNPLTKKEGLALVTEYKKIVTEEKDIEKIKAILKKYDSIGKNNSKRKKKRK